MRGAKNNRAYLVCRIREVGDGQRGRDGVPQFERRGRPRLSLVTQSFVIVKNKS